MRCYYQPLPSGTGSEVIGVGIVVTVDNVDTAGGGPKGRWVAPVLWRTVDILECSQATMLY